MGKIVAVDFGLKRSGLAITDELNMFAFGLKTVNSSDLMDEIKHLTKSENVAAFVLGLPKRLNNTDAHVTQNVYLLKKAIENELPAVQVVLFDERFTSKMASQSMHAAGATRKQKQSKELIDMVSATIILQSYLDSIR